MFAHKSLILKALPFVLLTVLNVGKAAHAGESNGVSRGGGDHLVTLEAMLPKTIRLGSVTKYEKDSESYIWFKRKRGVRCLFAGHCGERPDQVDVDVELRLHGDGRGSLRYLSNLSASYQVGGKSHPVVASFKDFGADYYGFERREAIKKGLFLPAVGQRQGQCTRDSRGEAESSCSYYAEDLEEFGGAVVKFDENQAFEIDGVRFHGSFEKEMVARLLRIEAAMEAQLDLASPQETRSYLTTRVQLERIAKFLDFSSARLAFVHSGFGALGYLKFEPRFLERLKSESSELLQSAQALIGANGRCNIRGYASFLQRLRGWQTGSAAYFYELENGSSDSLMTDRAKLSAMGLRQALRLELAQRVAPYCEPAASAGRSQVDLALAE